MKLKRILCVLLALITMLVCIPTITSSAATINKATVLVLDNSVSMEGDPLAYLKTAAVNFCKTFLGASTSNRIAIVIYDTEVTTYLNFTDNINTASSKIKSMDGYGSWTNIGAGIKKADELLKTINASEENIVVMTDGLPTEGDYQSTGRYNYYDNPSTYGRNYDIYEYANAVYSKATSLFNSYKIYSLGFFHNSYGDTLSFGERFLKDIQNAGYYKVTDPAKLDSVFAEIAKEILNLDTPKLKSLVNTVNGPKLTWSKVANASGYNVYRKTASTSWSRIEKITSGSTVSYTDKTAKSGTTYYYTVRAYKGANLSGYDTKGLSVLYLTAPTVKLANSKTGPQVSWGKITGATAYRVYRKLANGDWSRVGETTSTTFTDTTAKSGTTYYYTARALNGSALSSYRSGVALKYIQSPQINSLTVSVDGPYMTWNKISAASGYYIYRRLENGSWSQIGKTTSTSYKDKTANSGTKYYYSVKAYNGSTVSSWYSGQAILFLASPKLSSLQNSVTGPYLKWGKVTGAEGYYVFRRLANGSWEQIADVTDTSFRDTSAKPGVTYYYSLKAYKGTDLSSWRSGTQILCLEAPEITSTKSVSNGVKVEWNAVDGAKEYQVWRRVANGPWYHQGTTTSTSFTDNEVKVGSTFYYSIKAVNGSTTSSMRGGVAGTRK